MPLSLREEILFDCCATCAFSAFRKSLIYCSIEKRIVDCPEEEFCGEYK